MDIISKEEWIERYNPVKDVNGTLRLFTDRDSDAYTILNTPPDYVWTLKEENGERYIVPGVSLEFKTRIGFYISDLPCNFSIQVQWESEDFNSFFIRKSYNDNNGVDYHVWTVYGQFPENSTRPLEKIALVDCLDSHYANGVKRLALAAQDKGINVFNLFR